MLLDIEGHVLLGSFMPLDIIDRFVNEERNTKTTVGKTLHYTESALCYKAYRRSFKSILIVLPYITTLENYFFEYTSVRVS